jgi:hypothetical protein
MCVRNEDEMSYACAYASQRYLHDESQKNHPHPQISPVFLVGTFRRNEPDRLHAVVHPSPDCTALSAFSLSHTQITLAHSKSVTLAIRSKTNIPYDERIKYCDTCGTEPDAASATDAPSKQPLRWSRCRKAAMTRVQKRLYAVINPSRRSFLK